jgi:hypothetical protein
MQTVMTLLAGLEGLVVIRQASLEQVGNDAS